MHCLLRFALLAVMAYPGAGRAAEPTLSTDPFSVPMLAAPPRPPQRIAPHRSAESRSVNYERCMKQAREDPAAARKEATAWQGRGGGHPADHCLAVAMIGLGQYKDAGARLEMLAQGMVRAPVALRAEVLGQAAQAWLLAGDAERAYAADSAALALQPDDTNLLLDRAEAAGAAGWYDKAVVDLDRVLKADPKRIDALIYRASAQRALERLAPALADIDAALMLAPDSLPALFERGNIRVLTGDLDGARADWRRVLVMAPDSTTAGAAKKNLERLDSAGKPAPAAGREKPR